MASEGYYSCFIFVNGFCVLNPLHTRIYTSMLLFSLFPLHYWSWQITYCNIWMLVVADTHCMLLVMAAPFKYCRWFGDTGVWRQGVHEWNENVTGERGRGGAWREGHGTYKGRPTMNLITRYGLHGLVWVLGLGDFIVQNLAPPYVWQEPFCLPFCHWHSA